MTEKNITQERIHKLLDYNKETGVFTWKSKAAYHTRIGSVAGSTNSYGYVRIQIDGSSYGAHRLAWLYCNGFLPANEIDHINRTRNDNRLENLRLADRFLNNQNTNVRADNSSGYRGVSYFKPNGKWKAQIRCNNQWHHLGYHDTPELASAAYTEAKNKLHGVT